MPGTKSSDRRCKTDVPGRHYATGQAPFPPHNTTFRTAVQKLDAVQIFIAKSIKCLEGTTEQSDGNQGRSPRMGAERMMCLKGTTPQDMPPFPPHNTHV